MPDSNDSPGRPIDLLRFHRPKSRLHQAAFPVLKQESKRCLRNLAGYHAPKRKMKFPRSQCAAVLVALFVGRMGDLYVLLSRRSATLRTYPGDTSLPGGKVEPGDMTWEDAARREAFEEIGLPRDREKVPLLCVLEPFLASNQLIVTPVVVLIIDDTLRPVLNTTEVASLFSHPLDSFLSSTPPFPSEPESLEVEYHSYSDGDWNRLGNVRMHRFLTGREAGGIKPVFGLTAAILIRVAIIGYAREPDYELQPPDAPSMNERIAYTMLHNQKFRDAFAAEGLDPGDRNLASFLREKEKERHNRSKRRRRSRSSKL